MFILDDKPIVIIGGGPAGYTAALEIRKLFSEQKIILFEKNKLGGTCLHLGCIPSKQLHSIKELSDYPKLLQKNKILLEKGIEAELKKANIEIIYEAWTVDSKISFSHLIVATGSKPRTLKEFPEAYTSDSFFNEEPSPFHPSPSTSANGSDGTLPARSYCFIGGGYIGVELASMLAYHGKSVRIIEAQDQILGFLDDDIRNKLIQELKSQKIQIITGVKDLSSIELEPSEQVFVSVGRERFLPEGITANMPNVHFIGDVTGELPLAHYAYAEARALAYKLAGKPYTLDKTKVPLVIFSHPEVASIGLSYKEAITEFGSENIETKIVNWAANAKARIIGAERGLTKWIINKSSQRILGCHIIGEQATDLISIVVPIINMNPSIEEMQRWIYPHPTLGEIFSFT